MLYTLSPGGQSEFANVKLCNDKKCKDADKYLTLSALSGISNSSKILLATIVIYLSMLELDSIDL